MKFPSILGLLAVLLLGLPAAAQSPPSMAPEPLPAISPDIAPKFTAPTDANDYTKRDVMIPMRDGVKLHTVIVIPKGAKDAPILLTRTPYNASGRASRGASTRMLGILPQGDEVFVEAGYIRVFQDIRGKYGSEGDYVVTRPIRGPLNPTQVDHVTDAWDTIDWLVKNIPESNGRVGMLGSSYEGFTVVMALLDPHPALKVAAPMSAMIDGWRGDDWFHNGAFRQVNLDFFGSQMTARGKGEEFARPGYDDYETFRRAGSVGAYGRTVGLDQIPYYQKLTQHPAYDEFWSGQALDETLKTRPLKTPTMWIGSLWDQEDSYGAIHAYRAWESKDVGNTLNYLALGPWRHSQVNYDGSGLGVFKWDGDTALQFRRDVLRPFFDQYLKTDGRKADTPPVLIYDTGANRWDRLQSFPGACEGCATAGRPIYLTGGFGLSFDKPAGKGFDDYVSDPAKPVPYLPRPVRFANGDAWRTWLVADQRFVADRPDVLVYVSEPLTAPLKISGIPTVNLFASTSGTDSDWVVKLIDVYPDEVPSQPELGGYQLGIGIDIFRGRYRDSLSKPTAVPANKVQRYRFDLPPANHVFKPGHRIMVQVQSSLFPLYDRNPQTFVDNIFFAKPEDYKKATQRVFRAGSDASFITLPVVEN
ncbi:MAG: glutaryl-7-ACA acylase [Caulobacter sp.]|nr:glutaryl-7-ACA acylase [Caulobacter sp.]